MRKDAGWIYLTVFLAGASGWLSAQALYLIGSALFR